MGVHEKHTLLSPPHPELLHRWIITTLREAIVELCRLPADTSEFVPNLGLSLAQRTRAAPAAGARCATLVLHYETYHLQMQFTA